MGSVGPVCGATLGVIVERVDMALADALATVVRATGDGNDVALTRTYELVDGLPARRGAVALGDSTGDHASLDWQPSTGVVHEHVAAPPRVVVGGAGDVACEVIRLATQLGWRTALVDPRPAFVEQTLTQARPGDVVRAWPDAALPQLELDARTACLAAAHDERIDLPFLTLALDSDAFYVGSIGSRVVQHERAGQLVEAVGADTATRHHGPAGLNLGGSSAADIALSVVAEMLATWNGRVGASLRDSAEPIRATH
jgi:xanthine dehydrogenase accessory factor